jgi:NLI interacting factor-like phosphatase
MRKIYVDLDETLIHAKVAGLRPPAKRRRFAFGLEVYDVALRPCAHYLLGRLREIGCVSLLTTSQRDYAEKINEAFGLGFEQLYCREDIFVFRPFVDLKAEAVAPKSVLIDDLSPTETLARFKMKFLGINRRSYIQIRGFHGTEPATIDREIAEIVRKVRRFAAAGERSTTKDWHRRRAE